MPIYIGMFGSSYTSSGTAVAMGLTGLQGCNIHAWPWTTTGLGVKYANPFTYTSDAVWQVAFNPSSTALALAISTSPFIYAYAWSTSGFGSKFADPATLPPLLARDVTFSPSGDTVFVAHNGNADSDSFSAYPWSGSGFGSRYSSPPIGVSAYGVSISSANNIAFSFISGTTLQAWPWSTGFGTKYTDPVNVSYARYIDFRSTRLIYTTGMTPYLEAYSWSSGFGTKYTEPQALASTSYDLSVRPSGDWVAVANAASGTDYGIMATYSWSDATGFGTRRRQLSSASAYAYGVAFVNDNAIAVSTSVGTAYAQAYPFSEGDIGSKYADPATTTNTTGRMAAAN